MEHQDVVRANGGITVPSGRPDGRFVEINERFLEINLVLNRYSGVGISYSPMSGVKRRMYFRGRIEHYDRDVRFDAKSVHISIESLPDSEWEEKIKTEEKVENACGIFFVRANVEPQEFEKEFGIPPIQVQIAVTQEAFDAVSVHATETLDRIRCVGATIRLVGKSLPETGTGPIGGDIRLPDLDVSEDKSYAIGGFEVVGTKILYPRNRVLPIERRWDERNGARLSVRLSYATYQLDVPTGRAHSIRCHGSIIRADGKSYEGADVTIIFKEFYVVSSLGGASF